MPLLDEERNMSGPMASVGLNAVAVANVRKVFVVTMRADGASSHIAQSMSGLGS